MQGAAWVPGSSKLAADLQLAALVEQIHSNVEAIQLCTAFYISHAYIEVGSCFYPNDPVQGPHMCSPHTNSWRPRPVAWPWDWTLDCLSTLAWRVGLPALVQKL